MRHQKDEDLGWTKKESEYLTLKESYQKLRADTDEVQKKMTELEKQYLDLAESSTAAITSLADQRSELRTQIRAYRAYLSKIGVDPDQIKVM